MYIAVDKTTGVVIAFRGSYTLKEFVFDEFQDIIDYVNDDEELHLEDILVFQITDSYKIESKFRKVEDGYID